MNCFNKENHKKSDIPDVLTLGHTFTMKKLLVQQGLLEREPTLTKENCGGRTEECCGLQGTEGLKSYVIH